MDMMATVAPAERFELDPDIAGLDLESISYLVVRDEGWSLEKTDAVELEYRCWLQCVRDYPEVSIVPTLQIDRYWHQHILALPIYVKDCDDLFGRLLMHWPFSGALGPEDWAQQMARFHRSLPLLKGLIERVRARRGGEPAAG